MQSCSACLQRHTSGARGITLWGTETTGSVSSKEFDKLAAMDWQPVSVFRWLFDSSTAHRIASSSMAISERPGSDIFESISLPICRVKKAEARRN